jgi:hypothetical protein
LDDLEEPLDDDMLDDEDGHTKYFGYGDPTSSDFGDLGELCLVDYAINIARNVGHGKLKPLAVSAARYM